IRQRFGQDFPPAALWANDASDSKEAIWHALGQVCPIPPRRSWHHPLIPSSLRRGLRGGAERFRGTSYSRISSVNRFFSFIPAALRIVRMERAVRPCLPMTFP